MEWWKMQTFTERKVEKQENIECIEMYRNVSDKKMELYMYNSKKMELYMYNSKKMELYMYNSKKMELYIPIHFIVLVGFGAKVFESP